MRIASIKGELTYIVDDKCRCSSTYFFTENL